MDLLLQIKIEAQGALQKIYMKHLNNLILYEDTHQTKLNLFTLMNREDFIIPSEIFLKMSHYIKNANVEIFVKLLQKRKFLDKYVHTFVDICRKENVSLLSYSKLYALLTAHGLEKNVSHIYYLLDLLSNHNLQNICTKEFPVLNILQNHQTVVSCIDQFVCNVSYIADYKKLQIAILSLKLNKDVLYRFKPHENVKHSQILHWVKEIISKGNSDPDAQLGWTCGPDSARWPSTKLQDYKETLTLLTLLSSIQ
jgi:hypothetical protein